jgi:hypothetical protein
MQIVNTQEGRRVTEFGFDFLLGLNLSHQMFF